jgi:putative membrane protein
LRDANSVAPRRATALAITIILACYICTRILEILPPPIPRTAIVALDVLSALAFAMVDGSRRYRWRGILIFTAICIVVGNLIENLGVVTGFPFGRYYFVNLMGPKLFHVPVLLGLAYIGMAYVSWRVAGAILGPAGNSSKGIGVLRIPLLASFVMTAWDLAQDPVWSTVLHGWIWLDGGPWFGVPISNYLGWLGTVFIIFALFALHLRRRPNLTPGSVSARPAILFYALCAVANVLQVIPAQVPAVVHDPAGHAWQAAHIIGASALVSIFIMGTFASLAWMRLATQTKPAKG